MNFTSISFHLHLHVHKYFVKKKRPFAKKDSGSDLSATPLIIVEI